MTSNTIIDSEKKEFTISLTKAELDAIQKKLIEEYERCWIELEGINSIPSPSNSKKLL